MQRRTLLLITLMATGFKLEHIWSLNKDAPASRAVERAGHILCRPILGGLHHHYVRIGVTTGTGRHFDTDPVIMHFAQKLRSVTGYGI